MKMAPIPAKIGRSRWWAPVKYSASSPARMTLWRSCFIRKWLALTVMARISGRPLNKGLAGSPRVGPFPVISSLTASQGFVFSRLRIRRASNARAFQVEQQMVAGRDSAGSLLADGSLDEYRPGGIRSRRAQQRGAEGYRARQEADRSGRPRRHLCGGRLLGSGAP